MFSKEIFLSFSPQINPYFSHTHLSYLLLYQSYRDLCCERILGDRSVVITKVFILYFEEANLRVRGVSGSSEELGVEVRPRQASVLVVCCSYGNKRGTRESKEFKCELAL